MGAWDKAIDLYTEWVKKEKRWPLALPLSVFGAFLFFQKYYNLKFDETVWHWSFLLFCGIVIVISGTCYWLLERRKGHRIWVFLPMLIVGLAIISGGVWQLIPVTPPHDKLVICITRFVLASSRDEEAANECLQHMMTHLTDKEKEGVPISVRKGETPVMGADERARQKSAFSVARARATASHVVLWGDIMRDPEGIFIDPRLTIASSIAGVQLREKIPFQLFQMGHHRFGRTPCPNVADVVLVVYGLAYWKAGEIDKALEIMETAKSATGYYFQGLLHMSKRDYMQGAEDFERSVKIDPTNVGALNNLAVAYFYLDRAGEAEISLKRALTIQPDNLAIAHNLGLLQIIIKDFEGAMKIYQDILAKRDDFESRSNMAFCLFEMGRIDQAVQEWQHAYDTCEKIAAGGKFKGSCLDVQTGLAAGLFAIGNREQAVGLYSKALELNPDYGDLKKLKSDYFWPEKVCQTASDVIKEIRK